MSNILNIKLRSFVYNNKQIIEDYISSILGAMPKEYSESDKESVTIIERLRKNHTDNTRPYLETPASLFTSLYLYLIDFNFIKNVDGFASQIDSINKGDIIEIEGLISISDKIGTLLNDFAKLMKSPIAEPLLQDQNISEKTKKGLSYLTALQPSSTLNKRKIRTIKFFPKKESEFTIVLQIKPMYLVEGVDIEDLFNEEYTVLMKITRIIRGSSRYNLFNMPGLEIGDFSTSDDVINSFLTSFKNPAFTRLMGEEIKKEDFYVSSPALIAEVIGIYN